MGAADLSPEGRAARQAQGQVELLSSQPEHVMYANAARLSVQVDGQMVLRFEYHSPDGERPLVEVVMPPTVFINGILKHAHAACQDAAEALVRVASGLAQSVAQRGAAFGGRAPMPSPEQVARDRRRAAGDGE